MIFILKKAYLQDVLFGMRNILFCDPPRIYEMDGVQVVDPRAFYLSRQAQAGASIAVHFLELDYLLFFLEASLENNDSAIKPIFWHFH